MSREQSVLNRAAMFLWTRRNPGESLEKEDRDSPRLDVAARAVPRLFVDRVALRVKRMRHGVDVPWITADALAILETMLRPTDRGLEFGSGGSSIWLARRSQHVISIEAFSRWAQPLRRRIDEQRIGNLELELVAAEDLGYESPAHREAYVNARPELEPGSLDWVFVDGEYRDQTAMRGLRLLRPGGLLVLDNANLFLPTPSRVPWRIDTPATALWSDFLDEVRTWRSIWTTNGVWDTVIWIKPA